MTSRTDDLDLRFERFYNETPAMLHLVDHEGRILAVSDRWLETLGYERSEVVGRHGFDFLTDASREYATTVCMPRFFREGVLKGEELQFRTKDGRVLDIILAAVTAPDDDGTISHSVAFLTDITESKRIEAERVRNFAEIQRLKRQLERERDYLRDELKDERRFGETVGSSQAIQNTLSRVAAVAGTAANVLIQGESGVGKELIAREIHRRSDRAERSLIKVNCPSVPAELFESEFFGHVKGAFTGAYRDRIGRFELADGGTLFLDEAGEIPLNLQSKLLRVLQEGEFERVGDDRTRRVDVRIIAATNRDLAAEVKRGAFRQDLYYRLGVFPIEVPPLRDRREDIAPLAAHFLAAAAKQFGRGPFALSDAQRNRLESYRWPGNVRELQNLIERAVILSPGDAFCLDTAIFDAPGDASATSSRVLTSAEVKDLERANLLRALEASNWQISGAGGAAELLGLAATTVSSQLRVHGIKRPR